MHETMNITFLIACIELSFAAGLQFFSNNLGEYPADWKEPIMMMFMGEEL